jgi:hypothetical protein
MNKAYHLVLTIAGVGLLLSATTLQLLAQNNPKPFDIAQVDALIRTHSSALNGAQQDQLNADDIARSGVSFVITDEFLDGLKAGGAGPKTIEALKRIQNTNKDRATKPSNRLKILVARFADKTESNDSITDLIIDQLREATGKFPNVDIVALNENISAAEGATVAISQAKIQEADIIIWGWYKKSKSSVVIGSQVQIVRSFDLLSGNDVLKPRVKTEVQDIPNFENFTSQLRISGNCVCNGCVSWPAESGTGKLY